MYQYNPLLESTVARRLVDQGIITDPKKIKMMIKKGWIPSKKKTTKGLYKGAKNTLSKLGFKIDTKGSKLVDSNANDYLKQAKIPKHPFTYYGKKGNIELEPGATLKIDPLNASILAWHEAREAARSSSGKTKLAKRYIDAKRNNLAKSFRSDFIEKTHGHNAGVLSDEYKLNDVLRKRYNHDFQNNIGSINLNKNASDNVLSISTPSSSNPNEFIDAFSGRIYQRNPVTGNLSTILKRSNSEIEMGKLSPKQSYRNYIDFYTK